MAGTEAVNHEDVKVVDTVTGKSCFEWQRGFPETYNQIRSAAISPSGKFMAIMEANTLSIYPLPDACGGWTGVSGR